MRSIIVALFSLALAIPLTGQDKTYLFRNLDKENGLSNNNIKCFLRDKQGFLWVGTSEGLNRYDGYGFKVYKNDPNNPSSIKENLVTSIFEDHHGKLWVMAGDYLDVFDPVTETFDHSQSLFDGRIKIPLVSKSYFKFDTDSNIWFGNSSLGLYKYVTATNGLIHFPSKANTPSSIASDSITTLGIDSKGNPWIITTACLLENIDKNNGSVLHKKTLPKFGDHNYKLFIDSDDDIWISDQNNSSGVFVFHQKQQALTQHLEGDNQINPPKSMVSTIIQDNSGNIWIGTDHGGILVYNKRNGAQQTITSNPQNQRDLQDNSITAFYKDHDGFIWIGTFKSGIGLFHECLFNFNLFHTSLPNDKSPSANDIDNFAEDDKGNLWIGTNGSGLLYFDRSNGKFTQMRHNPHDPKSLGADVVIGMLVDSKNRLWAGTYFGGLNLLTNKGFKRFKHNQNDPLSLSDDRVWDICEDRQGRIWVATLLGGVNIIDPVTLKIEKIIKGLTSPLASNVVFDIYCDKSGCLWFSTVDGIRCYNAANDQWTQYNHDPNDENSLSKNHVSAILEDSRGWIWAATADGLNLLDRSTGKFKRFRTGDGLPSNYIITLLEDDQGCIWLSSSNGLTRLSIKKNKENASYQFEFQNYDELDGLQGKEFNEKSAFKTKAGELAFGGKNGFNLFDPDNVQLENVDAKTYFTDLDLFNKPISTNEKINGKAILKKSILFTDTIVLDYNSSVFSVEFSNLNFFFPEKRQYKYLMEGFHKEWILTKGTNRKATYTNLDPGTYTLRVVATNTNGKWDTKEARLTIVINPPWYATWWARAIFVLSLAGLVASGYKYRIRQFRQNQLILERTVDERTSELQELNAQLEERQEEISAQNTELSMHRHQLEQLVMQRTVELDIEKRKAEEADRLKSAFLANMSHEIRTPMNAIIGFSTLLQDETLNNNERNEYTDIIQNNCESLLVLINDVLDISKIEANQIDIHKTEFDLNSMFIELDQFYRLQQSQNVTLVMLLEHPDSPFPVYSDQTRIKQILQNLINNALKFTLNGSVTFGYKTDHDMLHFFVEDTGIGIDPMDYPRLFQQFSKLDNSNMRHFKGTGLGLAITKKLTELLGGQIWVDSSKGKGTTFNVSVPLR